jgi:hypothetical protein
MTQAAREDWRNKLQPIFLDLAVLNQQFERALRRIQEQYGQELRALGADPPDTSRAEIVARFERRAAELEAWTAEWLQKIDRRHSAVPYNPVAYSYLHPSTGNSADDGFLRYLHWMRHRESLETTEGRDAKGDLSAWDALSRTAVDLRRLVHRKGPLKPFQGDALHRHLHEMILCFEMEPLTAEERADCFDEYCACGIAHDADALRKQYGRLRQDLGAGGRAREVK